MIFGNTKKGFTLIELLVVISIIGLLSSVVLASLGTARAKARDSERKQALIQLRNAVELYYATNNTYPSPAVVGKWSGSADAGTCDDAPNDWYRKNDIWIVGLVPTYISKLPVDPKYSSSDTCSGYMYTSNGSSYKIMNYYKVESGPVGGGKPFSRMGPDCSGVNLPDWWDGDGVPPEYGGNNNNINDDIGQPVFAVMGGAVPGYQCS